MDITGPESFHTTMTLTLDLHAPVPAWIVNLATKKVRTCVCACMCVFALLRRAGYLDRGSCDPLEMSRILLLGFNAHMCVSLSHQTLHNHNTQVAGLFLYLITKETKKCVQHPHAQYILLAS